MLVHRERLARMMAEHDFDAVVAILPKNVFYLTEYDSLGMWSFPRISMAVYPSDEQRPPAIITADMDQAEPGHDGWVTERRTYAASETLNQRHIAAFEAGVVVDDADLDIVGPRHQAGAVAAYLVEIGLDRGRIGFDDEWLGRRVSEELPTISSIPAEQPLRWVRMVKTPDELAIMRVSARKNELATLAAIEAVAAGATFAECQRVYFATITHMGGQGDYMVGFGGRPERGSDSPDIDPDARHREDGDSYWFDAFGGYRHYRGDIGRSAIVGQPTDDQLRGHRALRDGWRRIVDELKVGMDSRQLGALAIRSVRDAGWPGYLVTSPHCIGLDHFEHPTPDSVYEPFLLEPGVVITVDLPLHGPTVGNLHTEDGIVIHEDGVEFLTSDDRLFVLVDGGAHPLD